MTVSEIRRLHALEQENTRLEKHLAEVNGIKRAGLLASRGCCTGPKRRPECARPRERISEFAGEKHQYGNRCLHVSERAEQSIVSVPISLLERKPLPKPMAVNRSWSVGFIANGLCDQACAAGRSPMTSAAKA